MIILKYRNTQLQIGLSDWKNVYQFPQQQLLQKEIHQGKLYYRLKGSSKRVSYDQIKKGLVKRGSQKKEIGKEQKASIAKSLNCSDLKKISCQSFLKKLPG